MNISLIILFSFLIVFAINFCFAFFAIKLKTDLFTDLSYSLSFFLLTILMLLLPKKNISLEQIIIGLSILFWSLRLGSYLFYRIRKIKRDHRFDSRRENKRDFFSFWILQSFIVFILMLPFSVFLGHEAKTQSIPFSFYLGISLFVIGFICESLADIQKFKFKSDKKNQGKWIDTGLWSISRHPNYFGEILLWWGLYIATISHWTGIQYLFIISPLFISLIIIFLTGIPPLEKKYKKIYSDNKDFQIYKERTPLLIPFVKIHKKEAR